MDSAHILIPFVDLTLGFAAFSLTEIVPTLHRIFCRLNFGTRS